MRTLLDIDFQTAAALMPAEHRFWPMLRLFIADHFNFPVVFYVIKKVPEK
jgi:hypothetical protein